MGVRKLIRVTTQYNAEKVKDVDFAQSVNRMYLVHLDLAPVRLERWTHTDWRWSAGYVIPFGPTISPPTGMSVAAVTPNTTGYVAQTYKYVITSIKDSSPVQESRASAVIQCDNDLTLSGNYNALTLPAIAGDVSRHVIYKEQGGAYGYIGATEGTSFRDQQIQPLLSETPPVGENPFVGAGNYPGAVGFHQQRLCFAATRAIINGVWMSRSADPENMDRSRPARSDDSLSFALVAERANGITHLVSLDELLCMTTDSIYAITGNQSGVITPSDINPKRTSRRGARKIKPLGVDAVTFFVPSRATLVRTLGFSFDIQGYKSDNVSIFAPHLFKRFGLLKLVYQEEPYSCIYALRDDGKILAFTWEAEQQVWGWTLLETDGFVDDIEVIAEGGFDRVYIYVKRTINAVTRGFYERMALPHDTIEEACHLDCAMTKIYDPPQDRITGVWHLEGATVSLVYDGNVVHGIVIAGGEGIIPGGDVGAIITVGLRYSGRVETLPAALTQGTQSNHVNRQQIGDVIVRTVDTRGIEIGANGAPLEAVEPYDGDDISELMDVSTRDYKVVPAGDWKDTSSIVIEQNEPLPAHIVSIFAKMLGATE